MINILFRKSSVIPRLLGTKATCVIQTPARTLVTDDASSTKHTDVCCTCKVHDKGGSSGALQRREKSGPVVMGVLPDNWFTFFHVKTGVSGGYLLLLGLTNYCVSKEIFVMDHEYYIGISIFLVLYYITTRLGPAIGKSLDKEVDALVAEYYKGRQDETAFFEKQIKEANLAVWRAEGQKVLMDAKKENVQMQLEIAYRERLLVIYKAVKSRLDYHVKRHNAEMKVQQKWMVGWIMKHIMQAITPEFRKRAMEQSLLDLENVAQNYHSRK